MAFGLFKKIAQAFTGKKSVPAKSGKGGAKGNNQPRRKDKNGKGRKGGNSNRSNAPRNDRRDSGGRKERSGAGNNVFQQPSRKERPRREMSGKGGRRGNDRRAMRGGNTAAGEMRPGGVISEKERAARAAAHAAWDPNSFVVEPMEGKKRFQDFNLPTEVLHGVAELGFKYCTDIQALSLEQALEGRNIAGKAQTGSGKTAAFLVAILTRYLRTPENRAKKGGVPRALVIAPTRELVIQICKDADAIGKY